jgi:VIT1/CCC1 family predicted Fe2+/Mn2+ transporter
MLVGFISFGLIVALFQYPALRREIPHLATWILANVTGWTLGAYLSLLAAGVLFQNKLPTTLTSVLVTVGITGLVAGAITGLALIWIVRQPDRLAA